MESDDDEDGWIDDGDEVGDSSDDDVDVLSSSQLLEHCDFGPDGTSSGAEGDGSIGYDRRQAKLKSSCAKLEKIDLNGYKLMDPSKVQTAVCKHFDAVEDVLFDVNETQGSKILFFLNVVEIFPILITRVLFLLVYFDVLVESGLHDDLTFFGIYERLGHSLVTAHQFASEVGPRIAKNALKSFEKLKKFHSKLLSELESHFGSMDVCTGWRFAPFTNARAVSRATLKVAATSDSASGIFLNQTRLCTVVSEAGSRFGEHVVSVGTVVVAQAGRTNVGSSGF